MNEEAPTVLSVLAHIFAGPVNTKRRVQLIFFGNAILLLGFGALAIGIFTGAKRMGH